MRSKKFVYLLSVAFALAFTVWPVSRCFSGSFLWMVDPFSHPIDSYRWESGIELKEGTWKFAEDKPQNVSRGKESESKYDCFITFTFANSSEEKVDFDYSIHLLDKKGVRLYSYKQGIIISLNKGQEDKIRTSFGVSKGIALKTDKVVVGIWAYD